MSAGLPETERVSVRARWPALPFVPVALSLAVLVASAFVGAPLIFDGPLRAEARLAHGAAYIVLAPLTRLLDELSLLTDGHHRAVLISWFVLCAVVIAALAKAGGRAERGSGGTTDGGRAEARNGGGIASSQASSPLPLSASPPFRLVLKAIGRFALVLLATVVLYAFGAVAPRPMVALTVTDPDILLVDFHSHTSHSHDGRPRWSVESNRRWHDGAGFHAAYVTDHRSFEGWREAAAAGALARRRPGLGNAGTWSRDSGSLTTMLPGVEMVIPGAHVNLIGVRDRHEAWIPARGGDLDTLGFATESAAPAEQPLVVLTLPFDIDRTHRSTVRPDAIELSDASPRGLGFARLHRSLLIDLADSLDVPLVAASNNHGWGRTAAAWSLLRIPQWRRLDPWDLDQAIRVTLREHPDRTGVVQRAGLAASPDGWSAVAVLPLLGVHLLRALTTPERVSVLAWIWMVWFILRRTGVPGGRRRIFA